MDFSIFERVGSSGIVSDESGYQGKDDGEINFKPLSSFEHPLTEEQRQAARDMMKVMESIGSKGIIPNTSSTTTNKATTKNNKDVKNEVLKKSLSNTIFEMQKVADNESDELFEVANKLIPVLKKFAGKL